MLSISCCALFLAAGLANRLKLATCAEHALPRHQGLHRRALGVESVPDCADTGNLQIADLSSLHQQQPWFPGRCSVSCCWASSLRPTQVPDQVKPLSGYRIVSAHPKLCCHHKRVQIRPPTDMLTKCQRGEQDLRLQRLAHRCRRSCGRTNAAHGTIDYQPHRHDICS